MMRRVTNDGAEHGYFTHGGNGDSQGHGWRGNGVGGNVKSLQKGSYYASPDGDGWGVDLSASLDGNGFGNGFPGS